MSYLLRFRQYKSHLEICKTQLGIKLNLAPSFVCFEPNYILVFIYLFCIVRDTFNMRYVFFKQSWAKVTPQFHGRIISLIIRRRFPQIIYPAMELGCKCNPNVLKYHSSYPICTVIAKLFYRLPITIMNHLMNHLMKRS